MKPVHLVFVSADNHNKFYDMIPNGNTFTIKYGRIGATCTTLSKPINEWDKIYRSKIKKGYVDKSHLIEDLVDNVSVSNTFADIKSKSIADVIFRLQGYANKTLVDNYKVKDNQVTQAMVDEARTILDEMADLKKYNVNTFNTALIDLFSIIPRKMKKVQYYLAESTNDFAKILKRESDLLDVMSTKVYMNTSTPISNNDSILDSLGITMKECDKALKDEVISMLGDIKDKYVNCWYVENKSTQDRYAKDSKKQINDLHRTEMKFWHGSRNENWLSILKNGMLIRPSGVTTCGAMFGTGVYFADRAKKSYGYTSANGSYWARGNSNNAFMAVFSVRVGKYKNIYKHDSSCYNLNKKKLEDMGHYDSVFAHKGADLINNEYIVYDPAQVTIYALVELKG